MSHSILELRNIRCSLEEGVNLFSDVNISVNQGSVPLLSEIHNPFSYGVLLGDIIVLQGRSGSGKSTLLKCISNLVLHDGETLYRGRFACQHTSSRTSI